MKKNQILFALIIGATVLASCKNDETNDPNLPEYKVITYTVSGSSALSEATEKDDEGFFAEAFNANIVSHEFADGKGTITFDKAITEVGNHAFNNCPNLTSLNLPECVKKLGEYSIGGYNQLETFTIPTSVTTISSGAFCLCEKLTSIIIPKNVTEIGEGVFKFCSALTSISVDGENPVFDSRDNCNAIIKKSTNTLLAGCKGSTIPEDVTRIEKTAFYSCTRLDTIIIPDRVSEIGQHAFENCGLRYADIGSGAKYFGREIFDNCHNLNTVICRAVVPPVCEIALMNIHSGESYQFTVYVPAGSVEAYKKADVWKDAKDIQAIP